MGEERNAYGGEKGRGSMTEKRLVETERGQERIRGKRGMQS